MSATILDRVLVYGGWYKIWRVALRQPDGETVERHIEDHGAAVGVLPYDPVRRCALVVSMPRAPVIDAGAAPIWEAIAGNIESDDPAECARREAFEEGGVRLGALAAVTRLWSMPALSTERLQLYLAPYAADDRVAAGGGSASEAEHITVYEPTLATLRTLALDGTIEDPKLLILVQALMLREPALFA